VSYLQYDIDPEHRFDVGLYVTGGDPGAIYFREAGKNVASAATMPVGSWQRLSFEVDLERRVYSAVISGEAAADAPRVICRDVAYTAKFNAFNMLEFSPQGDTGSELFLDDVSLRWTPAVMFAPPGQAALLTENFESPLGPSSEVAGDVAIDTDISFGPEARSLRLRGAGGQAAFSSPHCNWTGSGTLLIDLDLFPKSDQLHTQITPSPATTGTDDVGVAVLAADRSRPVVELRTRGGVWQHRSGANWTDSKIPVAFDAWHSFQVTLDGPATVNESSRQVGSYRILMQVIGEPPRELCRGELGLVPPAGAKLSLELSCLRSTPRPDGPAFDNVRVTRSPGQR
jgi:hypothetical protein